MLLNKFLSHFSYSAVQRSLEYLSHIDYSTIQFTPHHGNIMMGAKIKGTYYYHTHIIYSPAKNAIIGSECSCPVSDYCKHGAALAHVFYTNFLNDIDLSLSASNIAVQLNKPEEHLDNVVHFPNQPPMPHIKKPANGYKSLSKIFFKLPPPNPPKTPDNLFMYSHKHTN